METTTKSLIQLCRECIEAYNRADWERMAELMAPDCIYEELGTGRRAEGIDQIVRLFKGWKTAFPDSQGAITNAFGSGDNVALEVTWEGTHTGPMETPAGTIPPTGKVQVTPAVNIFAVEGEKIWQQRQYFDSLSLFQQLDIPPQ